MSTDQESRPGSGPATQGEVVAVMAMWALLLVMILITYTRLDPIDLYNVSRRGFSGGLSRTLVQVNFPVALVAIAIVLIAMDALTRTWWLLGAPAIALCAVTAWPGVVDDADLDARAVNVVPALGVALAVVLALLALRERGPGFTGRRGLDPARLVVSVLLLLLSVPWLAADLGFYLPDGVFITDRPITGADGHVNPAVHLGHHHGLDGALLAVSAVLLSRVQMRRGGLRIAAGIYVSLMFSYGVVNFAQDYWHEQVEKRGWSDRLIPDALEPAPEPIWLLILAGAAVTFLLLLLESPAKATRSEADVSESLPSGTP